MGITRDFSVRSIENIHEMIRVNVEDEDQGWLKDAYRDWKADELEITDYLNKSCGNDNTRCFEYGFFGLCSAFI